jgi:TPR repeat protein
LPPVGPDRSPASEPSRPQATSSSERRRTPRAKPPGLTYVKLEPDNGGRLLDVCESGIGFQVVAPVEETGRIQLWFVLDSDRHIEVSGELAWIDDTKRSGGLKFTRPSKQARQQLRAWLSHQRPGAEPTSSAASTPSSDLVPPMATGQSEPHADHLSHESEFERELHSIPHSDPAPLESLLDSILTSLQTAHPEDLFAHPALASDEVQAQPPAPEIEASGLVEKLAQEHALAMPSIQPPDPIPSPIRVTTSAALPALPPTRKPAIRRNAPVRPTSLAQTVSPASRELSATSAASQRAEKSTDVKYVQFRIAVDRVSGMLNTLRHAISADDSDWPLTAIPEPPPVVAAAPVVVANPVVAAASVLAAELVVTAPPAVTPAPVNAPVAAPAIAPIAAPAPAAKVAPHTSSAEVPAGSYAGPALYAGPLQAPPAQKLAERAAAPATAPQSQPELDVRPWSAGAPWRAAEPPSSPGWLTKLKGRANDFLDQALKGIAARVLRAGDAGTAAWTKTARSTRAAGAAFAAKAMSFLLAPQPKIAPMISRARRAAVAATANALRATRAAAAQVLAKARPASRGALATKAAAIPRPARAPQPATSIFAAPSTSPAIQTPQANLIQASREKLATATTEVKKASSRALDTLIPREPTRGEIGTVAAIALLLFAALAAFNYRDKFELLAPSFSTDATRALTQADPSPDAFPAPKKSSGRVVKARRTAPAPKATAQIGAAPAEPQAMPAPSTREMANALAYLSNNRGQRDPATAAKWLWAASRKGDTGASIVLADLYQRGDGVPQNCAQARVLLLAASKKGNEQATQKLQQLDATGCGN